MPVYFALTLFVSAALVFLVQPMCAKMVLPLLGGAPGVWNTCLVFFQAGLLAGYAYAHAGPRWLGKRRHALVHLGLLLVPLLLLPVAVADQTPSSFPVFWLLQILLVSVGPPFVMVAATAPLVQTWFADCRHPSANDPYYLYAASNLGSMLALLGYPFLVEPNFSLAEQSFLWKAGYGLLALLTCGCAALMFWHSPFTTHHSPLTTRHSPLTTHHSPNSTCLSVARVRWVLLALAPSSLVLSVTSYLTTDIAAIPLLWVLPLGLYLLSFILVFAGKPILPHAVFVRWLPLVVLILVLVMLSEATEPVGLLLGLHLLGLFWIAMVCHGELARARPPVGRLTEYYLWLALGGVLGGTFNALVAPVLFNTVVEYPLMLVLACLLRSAEREAQSVEREAQSAEGKARSAERAPRFALRALPIQDFIGPLLLGAGTAGLIVAGQQAGVEPGPISMAVMFAAPALICYTFMNRPLRFGLGLAAVLLAASLYAGVHGRAEYRGRSFFGVHRVTHDASRSYRYLIHGNTVHGQQSLDPLREREPLTYYYASGPIGQVFTALKGDPRLDRVGLIGLGTGALASYAGPKQTWTFFEIDPVVINIASRRFTYLAQCRGNVNMVAGDGRLSLAGSDGRFGLIVVDAFSSDAIPLHLVTREALQIYRSRLAEGGILAFHISNRYLDLEPVLANLASDAQPPMACFVQKDPASEWEKRLGKLASDWVVLANSPDDLKSVRRTGPWSPARANPALRVWTDDFSNLLAVFKWKEN